MQHESQAKIAQIIRFATRDRYTKEYRPEVAQQKTTSVKDLKKHAGEWLRREKLTLEFISGRWSVQGMDGMSHETIYLWIWRGRARKDPDIADLYKHFNDDRRRIKRGKDNDSRGILTARPTLLTQLKKVDNRRADAGRGFKVIYKILTVERCPKNRPIRTFDSFSPIQRTLKIRAVALVT